MARSTPDNPTIGVTDLLITYAYRLAFGAHGAEVGFAAAVSVFIFVIVARARATQDSDGPRPWKR